MSSSQVKLEFSQKEYELRKKIKINWWWWIKSRRSWGRIIKKEVEEEDENKKEEVEEDKGKEQSWGTIRKKYKIGWESRRDK